MAQYAVLGAFPFVDTKPYENDKADNQGGLGVCIGPWVQTPAQTEADRKERQSGRQKSEPRNVEVAELLPEGQMIQACVPLWWPIPEDDACCSCSPDREHDPLLRVSFSRGMKKDIRGNT